MPSIINALTASGGGVAITGDATGNLALQTAGNTAVTIDTSQNVGIGGTPVSVASTKTLTIYDATEARIQLQNSTSGATSTDGSTIAVAGADLYINNRENGNQLFFVNGSERMRITSGGALCINSTASSFNLRSSGVASAHFGDAYDASNTGTVQITRPANQGDNKFHLSFIRLDSKVAGIGFLNNSSTFAIQNADNNAGSGVTLTNGATSWGTTSDERKKDIIAPVENALSKLSDWRSVYYKYKTDKESDPQRVGLIAQDVQATLPEAVSAEEDEIQSLQLRYTETIPLLVAAIQELKAELNEVKAELDATKAEVQALKGVA